MLLTITNSGMQAIKQQPTLPSHRGPLQIKWGSLIEKQLLDRD